MSDILIEQILSGKDSEINEKTTETNLSDKQISSTIADETVVAEEDWDIDDEGLKSKLSSLYFPKLRKIWFINTNIFTYS